MTYQVAARTASTYEAGVTFGTVYSAIEADYFSRRRARRRQYRRRLLFRKSMSSIMDSEQLFKMQCRDFVGDTTFHAT